MGFILKAMQMEIKITLNIWDLFDENILLTNLESTGHTTLINMATVVGMKAVPPQEQPKVPNTFDSTVIP